MINRNPTMRLALFGNFGKETRQDIAHPARLCPAQVGNWNRQDRKLLIPPLTIYRQTARIVDSRLRICRTRTLPNSRKKAAILIAA